MCLSEFVYIKHVKCVLSHELFKGLDGTTFCLNNTKLVVEVQKYIKV